jgi:hypothetical protein
MAAGSGTQSTSFSGVVIGGLSNGQAYGMQLRVCNEGGACSTSSTVTATPYGPLGDPTLTASASGDRFTWSASGNGNGRTATLSVNDSVGTPSTQGAGNLALGPTTRTVGHSRTVTITARLSDPAGGRTATSASWTVTTDPPPPPPPLPPPPPKTVSVWKGSRAPVNSDCTSYYGGGACYYVGITTENFTGTYTCSIAHTFEGGGVFSNVTFTGSVSQQTRARYGYDAYVVVTCDGVTGRVKW